LLDIIGEITEHLIEALNPLDLLGILLLVLLEDPVTEELGRA
jgi:hypothetical protein